MAFQTCFCFPGLLIHRGLQTKFQNGTLSKHYCFVGNFPFYAGASFCYLFSAQLIDAFHWLADIFHPCELQIASKASESEDLL